MRERSNGNPVHGSDSLRRRIAKGQGFYYYTAVPGGSHNQLIEMAQAGTDPRRGPDGYEAIKAYQGGWTTHGS